MLSLDQFDLLHIIFLLKHFQSAYWVVFYRLIGPLLIQILGDDRSSEQPGLTTFHTLFQREHNRLSQQLKLVNPHWNDEKVFQEARKILIATHQQITYNEFLPRVLGPKLMAEVCIAVLGGKTQTNSCFIQIS